MTFSIFPGAFCQVPLHSTLFPDISYWGRMKREKTKKIFNLKKDRWLTPAMQALCFC
jgi:hypothetical protein